MKLHEIARKYKHVLVYGAPKVGKTELVGELAQHGFILHYNDFENGIGTLLKSVPESHHPNIEVIRIPDTKDAPIGIETALKLARLDGTPKKVCNLHGKVACPICLKTTSTGHTTFDSSKFGPKDIAVYDSLTQIASSALAHIGKDKDDMWKPDWDDWARQGNIMDRFLSSIQNSPFHVICVSHELPVEMNDGKEKLVPVAGTRNFSRNSAKYFDEVVYVQIRNKRHEAGSSTLFNNEIVTGSRSRTAIEDQTDREKHISLFPIFDDVIDSTQVGQAEKILTSIQAGIKKL